LRAAGKAFVTVGVSGDLLDMLDVYTAAGSFSKDEVIEAALRQYLVALALG
jgi:hypothetical protein